MGPVIRTRNMRNEAKLNIFKEAGRIGNFKNIAFSVANRHQSLLCYELASGNLSHTPNEYGPCNEPQPIEFEPKHIQDALMPLLPGANKDAKLSRPTWGKVMGSTIKRAVYIIITGCDGNLPTFSKIIDIVVLQVQKKTEYYHHACAVLHSHMFVMIPYLQMKVHSFTCSGTLYI